MSPVTYDDWGETEPQDPGGLIDRMRSQYPARLAKSMSSGDLKALDHGADLNQVVNAHRGVYRASQYGHRDRATREGTTRRGYAGTRMRNVRSARLTPDEIFASASSNHWDREEVIRQLTRFGYI